jgi:hypothetical protein
MLITFTLKKIHFKVQFDFMLLVDIFFQFYNRKRMKSIKTSLQTQSSSAHSFLEESLSINTPCPTHRTTRLEKKSVSILSIFLFDCFD